MREAHGLGAMAATPSHAVSAAPKEALFQVGRNGPAAAFMPHAGAGRSEPGDAAAGFELGDDAVGERLRAGLGRVQA